MKTIKKEINIVYGEHRQIDWKILTLRYLEPMVCAKACTNTIFNLTAEDIAQELRLQLWRKLEKWDPKKSTVQTWANKVLNNRLIDLSRKKVVLTSRFTDQGYREVEFARTIPMNILESIIESEMIAENLAESYIIGDEREKQEVSTTKK